MEDKLKDGRGQPLPSVNDQRWQTPSPAPASAAFEHRLTLALAVREAGCDIAESANIGALTGMPRDPTGMAAIVWSGATAAGATPAAAGIAAGHDPPHVDLAQFFYILDAKLFHNCKVIMANGAYSFLKVFGFSFLCKSRSYRIFFSSCNL
jgi:hypothetical protein